MNHMDTFHPHSVRILAIETSCDETAAAVVQDGEKILSNLIASQVDLHAQYGGVFPEVASREHVRVIYPVVEQAMKQANLDLKELDAVAVTRGPGLAGSLVVGLNMAKALSMASGMPLMGINHLEGHLYSAWLKADNTSPAEEIDFPLIALIVSGGHSTLVLMQDHLKYKRLGGTLDDAAGEAFDKVARLLDLPYPGGPSIQKAAEKGNSLAFSFPRSRLEGSWDFSFSGLKTAVLRTIKELNQQGTPIPVENLAASFQAAVVDALATKTFEAAHEFNAHDIIVAGGVSANRALRNAFTGQKVFRVHIPPFAFCTDNASMVAAAGYHRFLAGQRDGLEMDVLPNWPLA